MMNAKCYILSYPAWNHSPIILGNLVGDEMKTDIDVMIVGGSVAGLTAA